jgi:ketosteroid isomerase-like protein
MSQENVKALRARYEAVSKANLGAAFDDVRPEFELETGDRVPGAGTYRGGEAANRFFEDLVEPFEEVIYEPQQFFERGEQIVVYLLVRLQPSGSGAVLEYQIGALWTFREGKPVRCQIFPRREDALEAVELSDG